MPKVEDEMLDWEQHETIEGILTLIEDFIAKSGKQTIIYNMQLDNTGEVVRFFDTFSLRTIYKHAQAGDRLKITRTEIMQSRDGQRNFYTFEVERDEQDEQSPAKKGN